jgi:hypothetical protein
MLLNADNPNAADASEALDIDRTGCGHLVLMLGQGAQRDFRQSHSVLARLPFAPPTRTGGDCTLSFAQRQRLSARVTERLGTNRAGRFFRTTKTGEIEILVPDGEA